MNSIGAMTPRVGWRQRISASTPITLSDCRSKVGWYWRKSCRCSSASREVHLEREPIPGRGLHAGLEEHVVVLAGGLRLVQGDVRVAQQLGGARALAQRDADAGRERQLPCGLTVYVVRLAQHFQQALGDELGTGVKRGALDQDDELVAGQARRGVALADDVRQSCGDGPQQLVARGVAERVVDVLEAVDVDVQRRDRNLQAARAGEHLLGAVERQHAVGQAGESVVQRLVAKLVRSSPSPSPGRARAERVSTSTSRKSRMLTSVPLRNTNRPCMSADSPLVAAEPRTTALHVPSICIAISSCG